MDCKTARLLLDYARPRPAELPAGDAAALEGHLAHCADCDAASRGERQLDDLFGRVIRDVPAPDGLRDRLLHRLATERRTWYRRQAVRVGSYAAVAAAVLLVIGGIAWRWWPRPHLPAPDLDQIAYGVEEQISQGKSTDQVQDWFAARYGLAVAAPRELDGGTLNYNLLLSYDRAYCQGEPVPMLLFLQGSAQARIYILSDRQFNLAEDQDDKDSGLTVLYRHPPDNPHVVYVIVLSGTKTLQPFLTNANGGKPA